MNHEDIIRMAREAGVYSGANEVVFASSLERFFQAAYAAGAAAEREACAKLCDAAVPQHERFDDQRGAGNTARQIAVAIRARSKLNTFDLYTNI